MAQQVPKGKGDYREYMSWWDFHAFSSIVESINKLGSYIHVDIQSEPPQPPTTDLATIDWDKLLEADDRTYCAVGSPLVSGLSGYMLGKMFNVKQPFAPPPRGGPRLPFYFVWYPRDDSSDRGPYPNAFALCTDDLREPGPSASNELLQAIDDKQAQAFVFGNKVFEVWLEQEPHDQYGVVIAQRRAPGAIWAVVAGLSGPGTFACADILPEIKLAVPDCAEREVEPVTYAIVRSVIGKDTDKQFGDARKVLQREFVAPMPERWAPER